MSAPRFDPRVLPPDAARLVRALQAIAPSHLAGGVALSGLHLSHRLSRAIDLFFHSAADLRHVVRELPSVAIELGVRIDLVRDAGSFVRATATFSSGSLSLEVDLVHEPLPDIEPPAPPVEGITSESLVDLRAAKITCLLSRAEPRDLVDVLFLERAGFRVEDDLPRALEKDGGVDPGTLAWLLVDFPVRPLPQMLLPLTEPELLAFRDELRDRMKRLSLPEEA
jgi:hypothetical protein